MKNSPRIHAFLDGDLDRQELSAAEAVQAAAVERDLASVVDTIRELPPVDFRAGVMQRLPVATPQRSWLERVSTPFHQGWSWLWRPRALTIQLRPSYAVAFLIILALLPLDRLQRQGAEAPPEIAAAAFPVYVQFRLEAAQATSVSLAGSFSEWQPAVELQQSAPGVWTAMVPLSPGVHEYLFLVNGTEWVPDPAASRVADDFGSTNSRLLLALPTTAL